MDAYLAVVSLVSYLVIKKMARSPTATATFSPPAFVFYGASIYAHCGTDNNKTKTKVSDVKCRNKQSSVADFISNSAPARSKREERKVQRSSWRNVNIPNAPASLSSPSTVPPLAARPTSLAWEIIRKNLPILWWPLTPTSVDSKIFILFMNEPRKHFQNFQKFLLGVIALIPGLSPHQHQAHKRLSLSTHRPAFMVFLL